MNLGYDDSYLPQLSGAQGLSHRVGPVPRLLNGLADADALVLAERAADEVSDDGGRGDPRKLRNLFLSHRRCSLWVSGSRTALPKGKYDERFGAQH